MSLQGVQKPPRISHKSRVKEKENKL
jgi:hypothetical protein